MTSFGVSKLSQYEIKRKTNQAMMSAQNPPTLRQIEAMGEERLTRKSEKIT
jgi:small GTP-binding protein